VVELLSARKISELPVVDSGGRPIGLIDITDVIGWMPSQAGE
jgi:arabinose-5-phosphate isomerase